MKKITIKRIEIKYYGEKKPKDIEIVRKKQSKKLSQTKQIPIKNKDHIWKMKKIKGSKIEKKNSIL